MNRLFRCIFLVLSALCLLTACQQTPAPPGMKLGKPYAVDGRTYFPEYDPAYDKIGMASWYGPGFDGKYTASGEKFNQNDLTAAHPTLPMPSIVRVTNLSNGRSLIVRINDRGPFKSNRIIDLSKRAAEKLGMPSTTEVRVQFLQKETDEYLASLQGSSGQHARMMARNSKAALSSQIVEEDVANSHASQTIDEAAPVVSVDAEDLASPIAPKSVENAEPATTGFSPPVSHGLIKQAMADEQTPFSPPSAPAFYIQAGSFSTKANAQKLSSKLAAIGPVDIGQIEVKDKILWRVRLGPFGGQDEASEALEQVRSAHVADAKIIQQ